MKQIFLFVGVALLAGCSTCDIQVNTAPAKAAAVGKNPGASSSTVWQSNNRAAIDAATTPEALKVILADDAKRAALAGCVKSGYASDPIQMTQLGAATQYVMTPEGAPLRTQWVKALFAAASAAENEDAVILLVDQLRWCACVKCAPKILELGKRSPRVMEIAQMAAAEVTGENRADDIANVVNEVPCVKGIGVNPVENIGEVVAALKTYTRKDKKTLGALRRQPTAVMEAPLAEAFNTFSVDGKIAVLKILRERKSKLVGRVAALGKAAADKESDARTKERIMEEVNKISNR